MSDSLQLDSVDVDSGHSIGPNGGGVNTSWEKLAVTFSTPKLQSNPFDELWKSAESLQPRLDAARKKTNTNPTEAQIEAGNYAKGKLSIHGFRIAIENPKGSVRSGTSEDGKTWSQKLVADYGDIKGTVGADGDPLDVFLGPTLESELVVVINQVNPKTRRFDEVKTIIGCICQQEAVDLYLANYEDNWKGIGDVVLATMPQFKDWLKNGDTTKAFRLEEK